MSLDEELRHSFGIWAGPGKPQTIEVEIRDNRAADVRARRWPAEMSCTTLADGHVRITFSVTDPREVVAWVLSFGGDAFIRQPAAAARLAYELAQEAAASHKWAQDVPEDERLVRFDWGVDGLPLERRTARA